MIWRPLSDAEKFHLSTSAQIFNPKKVQNLSETTPHADNGPAIQPYILNTIVIGRDINISISRPSSNVTLSQTMLYITDFSQNLSSVTHKTWPDAV